MQSSEIRKSFLKFFEERGHTVVPGASLIPKDDPTLLFTIAGMVQFKPLWAGMVALPYKRAVSIQKCLRVTDLENVGKTLRHHTFFEMFGNFSFGDYFKKEAIAWAWEYLTGILKLDKNRLYVSVYEQDNEAYDIWLKTIGLEPKRVVRLSEDDNFWPAAGGSGACGPCSEIFYDMGEDYSCHRPECYVGCDCERYIEIWNLVFPQFNQKPDGSREPLKNRGIDTGMGFERLVTVLQKAKSSYHTDLFKPIIDAAVEIIGVKYDTDAKISTSYNIIADHIRALVFAITDGVIPSNEERGYVLRRLLRRARREAQRLNYEEPVLYRLVDAVVRNMKSAYSELEAKTNQISLIIKSEEERFLKTLDDGIVQFEAAIKGKRRLEGREAFKLYDTYGFPLDLIIELARERDIEVDQDGFDAAMAEQRLTSRKRARFVETAKWQILKEGASTFIGYEKSNCQTEILRWFKSAPDDCYEIVLAATPFYAEAGGQVGEKGRINGEGFAFDVLDTFLSEGMIVHECKLVEGKFRPGPVTAEIDQEHRIESGRAHTATHLLHQVLKKVLGDHVRQEGSLVEPGRFRFDFLHFNPLSKDELDALEQGVFELIVKDLKVEKLFMPLSEAKRQGAVALFGEKYSETVRVVKIDDQSMELCGGIHVDRTGEIGIFKIQAESSAAAGIRRIEARVGKQAYKDIKQKYEVFEELTQLTGADPVKGLKDTLKQKKIVEERYERLLKIAAQFQADELISKAEMVGSISFVTGRYKDIEIQRLRYVADEVSERMKNVVGFLVGEGRSKVNYIVFASREITKNFDAGELIKIVNEILGGKGGGRSHLAEGGGGKLSKIDEAILKLRQRLSHLSQ